MIYPIGNLGAEVPVFTTCPRCSYLWEGKCIVCEDDDPHPGCEGCVGGRLPKPPWYKSDLFVGVSVAVVISVVSSLIVSRIERKLAKK
jgi:hypothetical protein